MSKIVIPPPLKQGDTIGIVSVASKVEKDRLQPGLELLKSLGHNVIEAPHLWEDFHQFSAPDEVRASDFQQMIDNRNINAIICSRGGYGTYRTLMHIDWTGFKSHPKWIAGFSDITVIHSALHQMGFASVHGAMPGYFIENGLPTNSFSTLHSTLQNHAAEYTFDAHEKNVLGCAQGQLVGGNLSILYSLRGTGFDLDTEGKVLFIEDLNEYLYHIDRIMMNLKTGGRLEKLSGLLVGSFTKMKDNDTPFGMSVEEIVLDAVKEYGFPVAFGFPAGHQKENWALGLGTQVRLSVEKGKSQLHFENSNTI
jgi:muramoyltetrapeptide carboxypeptidase